MGVGERNRAAGRLDRRAFLKGSALLGLSALSGSEAFRPGAPRAEPPPAEDPRFVTEARYYDKLPHKKIQCKLCPRECLIDDRERGYCGVRENRGGTYYTLVHSRPCTIHSDPIEKKPLFHFLPGTLAFSLSTAGCNVNCRFCQNWQISQVRPEQVRSIYLPPPMAASGAAERDCASIAYTYGEPVVFFEYLADTAKAARRSGLRNVVITGGYVSQDPLKEICSLVDAIKVDLKGFTESYFKDIVNGELRPVLDALVTIRKAGVWAEIVYLVVPTLNDGETELTDLCRWVMKELGPDVPVHFTRFHPDYLLKNLPPTPISTLERAKAIADSEGLHFAYLGNVPGHPGENTTCPSCGRVVIERAGFFVKKSHLVGGNGACPFCEEKVPGVWS